jgi:hypothetical protein
MKMTESEFSFHRPGTEKNSCIYGLNEDPHSYFHLPQDAMLEFRAAAIYPMLVSHPVGSRISEVFLLESSS